MNTDWIPYPGPRPFETGEKDVFFGREKEIQELYSLVIAHRAILLYAQSGAGKSSLLNAGLVPLLKSREIEVLPVARVQGVDPARLGVRSVANIFAFNAILSWAGDRSDPVELASMRIAQFLGRSEHARDKRNEPVLRVAFFDQFEELFTAYPGHWKERERLIEQIAEACAADELLRVVLVMREDHVADLDPYAELLPEELRTTYRLERLGAEAAIRAVERPVLGSPRSFADGVPEKLVSRLLQVRTDAAAGEETRVEAQYVEPVQLQVVCRRLWQRLPADVTLVSEEHVQLFGDVDDALRSFYEDAVAATVAKTATRERKLREWFDGQLITPAGTRGTVFQGETATGGIPNAAVHALEGDHHIVRSELRHGSRWYELTHDRFIEPIRKSNAPWLRRAAAVRSRWRTAAIAAAVLGIFVAAEVGIGMWQKMERQAEQKREQFQKQAEDARRDAEVAKAIEHARLEEAERLPGEGMIEKLRAVRGTDKRAEAILDGVTSYLWAKEDIGRLASLLEKNKDLVPDRYGLDDDALRLMPDVDADADWPLTVEYSARAQMDERRFRYHWRSIASQAARLWGLPVPMRVKLVRNENLPADQFAVVSIPGAGRPDDKRTKLEERVKITTDPADVVVLRPGSPAVLARFFEQHKKKQLKELKYGGEWWLVPAWTQPVWKVSGHGSFNREGALVLAIANRVIDRPELALNRDSVGYLLGRLAQTHRHTVSEALAARGLDRLTEDLSTIVAKHKHALTDLEYLLDSLAHWPGASPAKAAEEAYNDVEFLLTNMPSWRERRGPSKGTLLDEVRSATQGRRHVYEEASAWLPRTKPPIRVYLGAGAASRIVPNGDLAPEVKETLPEFRKKFFDRFGFEPPGVKFYLERSLPSDSFSIEVASQKPRDKEAVAVPATRAQVFEKLMQELEARYFGYYRGLWLTPEAVAYRIEALPEKLRDWLKARYSVTDLKLILRAVVDPTQLELQAHDRGDKSAAAKHVPPENTLKELDWLLGSLVFWEALDLGNAGPTEIAAELQRLQRARIDGAVTRRPVATAVAKNVDESIQALREERIEAAAQGFREAARRDRRGTLAAFHALYPATSGEPYAQVAEECVLPRPGRVARSRAPSMETRYRIEAYLEGSGSKLADADRRRMELCLLSNAVREKHVEKAEELRRRLMSRYPSTGWKADEEYLFAYLLLDNHGRTMSPPASLPEIERLLHSAFSRLELKQADSAFLELRDRHESFARTPGWYVRLLKPLPQRQPESYWMPYLMGAYLSAGKSLNDCREAIALIAQAENRLTSFPPEQRAANAAWLGFSKASALIGMLDYERTAKDSGHYSEAKKIIEALIAGRPADAKDWPSLDDLFGALVSAHYSADRLQDVATTVDEWRRRVPDSGEAVRNRTIVLLAKLEPDSAVVLVRGALEKARGALDRLKSEEERKSARAHWENTLMVASFIQILVGKGDYEHDARACINDTQHGNRDFVRLLLYWRLKTERKDKDADELIRTRMAQIDPASWEKRLLEGDSSVWGEKLVAFYASRISRDELFRHIRTREAFESTPMNLTGLSFESISTDTYFYDALLQNVSGDASNRRERLREGMDKVSKIGKIDFFETHMARYLLKSTK